MATPALLIKRSTASTSAWTAGERAHRFGIRDIDTLGRHGNAERGDVVGRRLQAALVEIADHHARAAARAGQSRRTADAAARAGDQGCLARQCAHVHANGIANR
jgi:hypothetical protein